MADEHATHAGFADISRKAEADVARTRSRAELDDHCGRLERAVHDLRDMRERITELEADPAPTVVCVAGHARGDVKVQVAKADVLDQMRLVRDDCQRGASKHLEAIAAFIEGN